MTVEELGQMVKSKHPEYSNYSDAEIGVRTAAKFPEYRMQIGRPSVQENAQQIEPGVYGETNPPEQKLLQNSMAALGGVITPLSFGKMAEKALSSRLGRAILNSPQEVGAQMEPGLESAGVVSRPPELAGSVKFENPYSYPSGLSNARGGRFPRLKPEIPAEPLPTTVPTKYPQDPATFYNFAKARINQFAPEASPEAIKLTPQELTDYKSILSNTLTEMKSKGMQDTPIFAYLSDLQSNVTDLHNAVIPGRADLNKVYALSTAIRAIPGQIYRGAKAIGKYGTIGAVAGKYLSQ